MNCNFALWNFKTLKFVGMQLAYVHQIIEAYAFKENLYSLPKWIASESLDEIRLSGYTTDI